METNPKLVANRAVRSSQICRPAGVSCGRILVLVLSNTKAVHLLDCSFARIFASTNLTPRSPPPPFVVAFFVVVAFAVVVLRARCLRFTAFWRGFKGILPTFCANHHVHPTTVYTNRRLHQPPYTPTTLYTKVYTDHRLHHTTVYSLRQTMVYTNHRLHQNMVYTHHCLHRKPWFATTTVYTSHTKPRFTPTTLYTTPPFTPTTVCTTPPFTPNHGLHQP